MGPVASQEAIKMLGTNGGGFFNANSAHPYENPTPLTNFFQMLSIFLIPGALCYTFGRMVGDTRQGWAVLAAMTSCSWSWRSQRFTASSSRATRCSPPLASIRPPAPLRRAATWKARKPASASPILGPVRHHHHRRLLRRGHRHARLVHPARRHGAAGADATGRSGVRRRRFGSLRHAGVRHHGGLHRRADDRPHARISGQEDRSLRDEDGVHRILVTPLLVLAEPPSP
jgi:hypothetical protein